MNFTVSLPQLGLLVKFTACDRASFSYTSLYGNGSYELRRLTLPSGARCDAN